MAQSARIEAVPLVEQPDAALINIDAHISAYRIEGPLLFAAADRLLRDLSDVDNGNGIRAVIVRLSRITAVDATAAIALREALRQLEDRGFTVYASGLRPEHAQAFNAVNALRSLQDAGRLFDAVPQAVAAARAHMSAEPPGVLGRQAGLSSLI